MSRSKKSLKGGIELTPLAKFTRGDKVIVEQVEGGHGFRCRLQSLGIFKGKTLEILRDGAGPVLVKIDNCRIALGHRQAMKILCRGDGASVEEI